MDSAPVKKQKIVLEDYPFKQDLENRLLMAQFTENDLVVLEEILYSSIKVSLHKLAKNTQLDDKQLLPILVKLSQTGLFVFEEEHIVVDKELRKYFESQLVKFDPDFKPGMEFVQSLLHKVPIHVLPQWYSIPRLSDHIFESIMEKYLLTPHVFHRYLSDLCFPDPLLHKIIDEVYSAPSLRVYGKTLMDKYQIPREKFEEYLLLLEFHLVCCLSYEKEGALYKEVITPFHEWHEYAEFLTATQTQTIPASTTIIRIRPEDFSYVTDLAELLQAAKKTPFLVSQEKGRWNIPSKLLSHLSADYLSSAISKLIQLKLADVIEGRLCALQSATDFLEMPQEHQALFLYRHPLNRHQFSPYFAELLTDRTLREAEKSICRVLTSGWVYFDDFIKGATVPLNDNSSLLLKKQGKSWKYQLPTYSDEELAFLKAVVLEWLFETGITAVGTAEGKECFCVTPFGQSLFGQ